MTAISGLGKLERKRLTEVLRGTKGTISVEEAAYILNVSRIAAAKMLALWTKKGWLSRVRRGIYVPMPIESRTTDVPLEDAWVVAARLFAPCYIGGWSAAEYWNLTEQIYSTIVVVTLQKPRKRNLRISGSDFLLRTTTEKAMYGLSAVWRETVRVAVSDPSRTILDMFNDPRLGGGIRPTVDIFVNYLRSKEKNLDLLVEYARRLDNGAVFKRLGFLLEQLASGEKTAIAACQSALTKGYAKLDPALDKYELVTRWRLWLPKGWKQRNISMENAID
jgi:predicted transcriptional regulator of viral defense system